MQIDFKLFMAYKSNYDIRDMMVSLASSALYTGKPVSDSAVVLILDYHPDAAAKNRFRIEFPPAAGSRESLQAMYGPQMPLDFINTPGPMQGSRGPSNIRTPVIMQLVSEQDKELCVMMSAINQEPGPVRMWQKQHGKTEPVGWQEILMVSRRREIVGNELMRLPALVQ